MKNVKALLRHTYANRSIEADDIYTPESLEHLLLLEAAGRVKIVDNADDGENNKRRRGRPRKDRKLNGPAEPHDGDPEAEELH
jgi:hypothetical protein